MSTPMLEQYNALKSAHRDAILLYRLGDFYEMFGQDARDGSRILGLTLTQRQNMPMCGVPHHAARSYIARLLKSGRKVAICEQVAPPDGRTITPREVVEVLSPGAVYDSDLLEPTEPNNLLAIGRSRDSLLAAWCDASTGSLTITDYPTSNGERADAIVRRVLATVEPRELLVQETLLEEVVTLQGTVERVDGGPPLVVNRLPDWSFDGAAAYRRLVRLWETESLAGFGVDADDPALAAVTPLLDYLEDNARHVLSHLHGIRRHRDTRVMVLDEATIRNLELLHGMRDGSRTFSLLSILDETATVMGARLLRERIVSPSRDLEEIERRLEQVGSLYHRQPLLTDVRGALGEVHDLQRLVGRLGVEKAHPKDLLGVARTVRAAERLAALLPERFDRAGHPVDEVLRVAAARIESTIRDDAPVNPADGGIIATGIDPELDELRTLHSESGTLLDQYLEEQRTATGLSSLKIKYNRVLGHFFEVPSSVASRVPESYIRRQSLANAERFTTPYLSDLESRLQSAGERAIQREQVLFLALRADIARQTDRLALLAARIAEVDVDAAFARVATVRGYRRPSVVTGRRIEIRGGRHPVVEAHLPSGDFVANDLVLGNDKPPFALVTGPNMAGKSTVLRQTALIVLMAQIGSWVPADEATIGVCDRLFCRVGASDNIARGESTFLVEMNETANILNNATSESLIIMDEVGRGTSTHDGLAIAWAVSEYLLERVQGRTLFATHYHELGGLDHPDFRSLTMAVEVNVGHSAGAPAAATRAGRPKTARQSIVFLKKLIEGRADRSYGVDVARRAGLPEALIARATAILEQLEAGESGLERHISGAKDAAAAGGTAPKRASDELFSGEQLVVAEIASLDPDTVTARDALERLYRWHAEVRQSKESK